MRRAAGGRSRPCFGRLRSYTQAFKVRRYPLSSLLGPKFEAFSRYLDLQVATALAENTGTAAGISGPRVVDLSSSARVTKAYTDLHTCKRLCVCAYPLLGKGNFWRRCGVKVRGSVCVGRERAAALRRLRSWSYHTGTHGEAQIRRRRGGLKRGFCVMVG